MEFLFSNLAPLKTKAQTFREAFYSLLIEYRNVDIAVGYITSDSLAELKQIVYVNEINRLNLTIGMHYFEKFTKPQYQSAIGLNKVLKEQGKGCVRLVKPFKFHGKLYSYSNNESPIAGIIGSDNLGSIMKSNRRIYETSLFIDEPAYAAEIYEFINRLNLVSIDIDDFEIEDTDFIPTNPLLEGHENVKKIVPSVAVEAGKTDISFEIPIKPFEEAPKSNMNIYFGVGRKNMKTGFEKPRHWYEVALTVPAYMASLPHFPVKKTPNAIFDVITDDGWGFQCIVSGKGSKTNFRSKTDLKILGKWLKGRLENAGVLQVGEHVTRNVLDNYGRNTLTFTKTNKPNLWYLDFKV